MGDAGTYSVHLYYMLDGKRTYITELQVTVPLNLINHNRKLTNNGSWPVVNTMILFIVNKKHGLSLRTIIQVKILAKPRQPLFALGDDMINQGLNVGRSYSGFRSYDYQRLFTTTT